MDEIRATMHVLVCDTQQPFFSPFFLLTTEGWGWNLRSLLVDVYASSLKSIFICTQISLTTCVIFRFSNGGLYFYCVSLLWQWCSKFSLFFFSPLIDAEENFDSMKGNFSFLPNFKHFRTKKYSFDCCAVNILVDCAFCLCLLCRRGRIGKQTFENWII